MIFGPFERMVAGRYLRARRQEGFVSVIVGFSFLGIALGVATLIIVMAVMNGFREDILSRILGVNDHIDVTSRAALTNFDALAIKIRKVNGVVEVTPIVEGQAMIVGDRYSGGALVRGIRADDLRAKPWIADHVLEGSLDEFAKGEGILIGTRMAERYGVHAGQDLSIVSSHFSSTAFGTVPRMHAFPIAGVFNVGMSDFDAGVIFMPLDLAQKFFGYPDAATDLEVRVANPDQARAIAMDIASANEGLRVLPWEEINGALFTALQVERNVMFLILTLIILVAAFNIISGLIMMVKDKGRDIAILRTMGATRGMVMRIFLLAGTSVGTVGTALGYVIGKVFCDHIEQIREFLQRLTGTELFSPEIYYLTQIPAKPDWHETLAVVLISLFLSLAATLYPSWRAARTDPVEALRYE
jgi:lipoprotein-releasing system permease protein